MCVANAPVGVAGVCFLTLHVLPFGKGAVVVWPIVAGTFVVTMADADRTAIKCNPRGNFCFYVFTIRVVKLAVVPCCAVYLGTA